MTKDSRENQGKTANQVRTAAPALVEIPEKTAPQEFKALLGHLDQTVPEVHQVPPGPEASKDYPVLVATQARQERTGNQACKDLLDYQEMLDLEVNEDFRESADLWGRRVFLGLEERLDRRV